MKIIVTIEKLFAYRQRLSRQPPYGVNNFWRPEVQMTRLSAQAGSLSDNAAIYASARPHPPAQLLEHVGRDQATHVAAEAEDFLQHPRTDKRVAPGGLQEDGLGL
jgi:hypothetical protein